MRKSKQWPLLFKVVSEPKLDGLDVLMFKHLCTNILNSTFWNWRPYRSRRCKWTGSAKQINRVNQNLGLPASGPF